MDLKPVRRIKDPEAIRSAMNTEPWCRKCGVPATDPHHIILKSQGGDDVFGNIMPLCHKHHDEYHKNSRLEANLHDHEVDYMIEKLGESAAAWYAFKHYGKNL